GHLEKICNSCHVICAQAGRRALEQRQRAVPGKQVCCAKTRVGRSIRCWTSSCWPSGLSFSRFRSATPTHATGSEEALMIFDYSLAGVVMVGLMIYLVYALLQPEKL